MEEEYEDHFFFNIRLLFKRPATCVVAESVWQNVEMKRRREGGGIQE